ncbi:MAG: sulfatase-like hydrolase/transferase [Planctomycetes bacterium]|nr:sulfatase-like hydrolase/transferase [Planctomycetota bacterium]
MAKQQWMMVCTVLLAMVTGARAAEKPNVLFILVDDLGKEWIHCYGAEGIETPNIDGLAAGGMRFVNAYGMPQCTPTRMTLLTGQYPFHHGWTNHWDVPRWGCGASFDPNHNNSFGLVMRQAGYATCAVGKWQIDDFRVEPKAMDAAGFDDWCMWTGFETNNPPSDKRYWDPYLNTPGEGSKTYEGKFGPDVVCDHLIEFMKKHRDEPMFLYYPMILVHMPTTTTPDDLNAKSKLDQHKAMVRYTDKLVGRVVATLDELKLREKTIIVFTTDNGTGGVTGMLNGHRVPGAKAKMNEAGVAMPFIVNCPGTVPSGVVTEALVDFTDLLPTFSELGGGHIPADRVLDGHSFAPLILGKASDTDRDWILAMGGGAARVRDGRVVPAQAYDDRVMRDQRFKLWVNKQGEPEAMYDMKSDPWETTNVLKSSDPAMLASLAKFKAALAKMPKQDAAPQYDPNPPQKWDLHGGQAKGD